MLEELGKAVAELAGMDPDCLADKETIVELHRCLSRLEAVTTRAVAAFDSRAEWAYDGARGAAAWLTREIRSPKAVARRRLRLGRALRCLPVAGEAWLAGDIEAPHVSALWRARTPETAEAMARDEALLVDQARSLSFQGFSTAVAYWAQLADPDGAETDHQAARDKRKVFLDQGFGGNWCGQMYLDPISGAIVAGELERLEKTMFESDWAEAKARLGRDPLTWELARTHAQRMSDALVEMAVRSGSMCSEATRPRPLFSVLVGYETLHGRICELANGTVLSPGSLLPWLDGAYIERAVFGPKARVEVSERARLFTGATRRAIELRDRFCAHPYCEETLGACQVDHVIPYSAGGPTTQDNGRLLCGYHNRLRLRRPPGPAEWSPPRRT